MKLRPLLAFCMCMVLMGCGPKPADDDAKLRALLPAWDDTMKLIMTVPRAAIPPQIAEMQKIRREAEEIEVGECMQNPKKLFVAYMQSKIDKISEVIGGIKWTHQSRHSAG